VASFDTSNTTAISLSAATTVNGITFNPGASAFTITNPALALTIDGIGLVNNSGVMQNFVCNSSGSQGLISFTGSASAGSSINFIANGLAGGSSGSVSFFDDANAAGASFVVNGSSGPGTGLVDFYGNSTAGSGTFACNGSTTGGGAGGEVIFHEGSNAGSAILTTFGGVASGGGAGGGGFVRFFDTASGANCSITNNAILPGGSQAGETYFGGSSVAGSATILNKGGTPTSTFGGITFFTDNSSADNAVFTNESASADFSGGGQTLFVFGGEGGNATFINYGGATTNASGGLTDFSVGSKAENATLIAYSAGQNGSFNGGQILFDGDSDGGTARVILFGNGKLNVTGHDDATPITVGSVEGDGRISLGYRDLVVGSNNHSTTFSGGINSGGGDGTLTKIGRGSWTLTGNSSYSVGTFINGGRLIANNPMGSPTGASPVLVNKGILGGSGTLAGTVTVGSGRGRTAEISPGSSAERNVGTFTIQGSLSFASDGIYTFQVDSDSATSDSVVATGVVINSGAQFQASDLGSSGLPVGTSFVALDNTSVNPISGTFSNLPDDGIVSVNGNNLQASYEGGDGNDLTLTVVP
jgi:autotransporter-associated beta strand protein